MPFDPKFYGASPPSDLSRQFSDYSQATPATGAAMAARALRESLEKRFAREDRIAEIEGDRNFQRETLTRQENFQRGREIFQYESQRISDARAAEIARGHDIASIERESLQQRAENLRAQGNANARLAEEQRKSQDAIDAERAYGAAQSVLSGIRSQSENPFFRRQHISAAQLLDTNKTEEEIINEMQAGAKDARPYMSPEGETALKSQLKDYMKGREVELYNPAAFGNLSILVTNGALDQLGTREISQGMQLGIAKALNDTIKSMPTDEHTAALAMREKFREDLGSHFKNLVGTPAPAANQTQTLGPPGVAEMAQADPRETVAVAEDFPDALLQGIGGSKVQGDILKAKLFGAGGMDESPHWVPKPDGTVRLVGAAIDDTTRATLEAAANQGGPYAKYIQGRLRGVGAETRSQLESAGSKVPPPTTPPPAKTPPPKTQPKAAPAATVPGSAGSLQTIAPHLIEFLNGEPKK